MIFSNYWAIMNVKTKLFLPSKNTKGGGATSQEFSEVPRLFVKRQYARSAAKWWCEGIHYMSGGSSGDWFTDPDEPDLCVRKVPERKLEDLRIVSMTLICGIPEEIKP